ncbi:hydantoinase/oxoprolinase family protein [Desulfocicer niacini]
MKWCAQESREWIMIIGLDVGGTHTDAVLLTKQGLLRQIKVPTDRSNLFKTVLTGFNHLLKDIPIGSIKRVVISTTLTTNAIVQKQLNTVGIIVSSGPGIDPEWYRTDAHYHAVAGSIDHRGRERKPLDHKEILAIAKEMKEQNISIIGVIGKFSVRNPTHEIEIQNLLKDQFETIFLGHHVSGNLNFPRRISTVHLNASVYEMHRDFFHAVKNSLEQKGLKIPIQILKADGGTMNLESSMAFPGQTILSGPAASVMGSIAYAPEDMDAMVLDIGGTTTDIAILVDKVPLLEPLGIRRGKYKSLIRSLKTYSRGIGGDSRVRVERGKLRIGPDRLGPAMAFGGPSPTPTDALVFLKKMDTGDPLLAQKGIEAIAQELNISPEAAAQAIFKKTCTMILDQARALVHRINTKPVYTVHEFLAGYAINPRQILLLGGPAPYFAEEIQAISGIPTKTIPESAVANAIGAALARTTCEVSLLADTEQGKAMSPEEDFTIKIPPTFSEEDAVDTTHDLLRKKALKSGASTEDMAVEIIEYQKFNIVRNFSPRGKIFKVKMQVKPGLIKAYDAVCHHCTINPEI